MHPHWRSTEDAAPVRVGRIDPAQGTGIPVAVSAAGVSRRPAAITGIVLTLTMGFLAYEGLGPFRGQVGDLPTIEVHITSTGVVPSTVSVAPGQKITWYNDQNIPHILQSDTIFDPAGKALYTPAIFPGMQQSFTVSPAQSPGANTYLSTTAKNVSGQIIVTASTGQTSSHTVLGGLGGLDDVHMGIGNAPSHGATGSSFSSSAMANGNGAHLGNGTAVTAQQPSQAPSNAPSSGNVPLIGTTSSSNPYDTTTPPSQDALIPRNPYAIGSVRRNSTNALPVRAGSRAHSSVRRSSGAMPATGPELWVVYVLSVIACACLSQSSLLTWEKRKST
ncbi:hypothetical protein HY285_05520 [Candidatus Peregrinibacteria bacterium]|nr:hypothetical protein [Candidatus Peregrinibacteria bacterium]MBI3816967.1 hypothetical protein [Candidatus Peregrinibacteria bacterium]